jgi:quercetin dioxygenase-like cupin family protein
LLDIGDGTPIIVAQCCATKGAGVIAFDLDDFDLASVGPGLRASFPLHSATGTASTATVLFELDPGAELPVHTDSAEELLIVVQGTAQARVDDEMGRLEAHQVALVPPMAPHGLQNIGDDVLRVLGTFSASTVVSTFEEPLGPGGPQLFVIGAPMPVALPLGEPIPA